MSHRPHPNLEPLVLVKHTDMEFILFYLNLDNFPPISVEAAGRLASAQRPPP
jgi:hypothetical protein